MAAKLGTLNTETRRMLLESSVPLRQIAKALDLEYQWLLLYRNGEIRDPGCSKIQAIYEFLTGRSLAV